ncbi:mersacidin/lichenicidin family type 2 lantibiotic [Archangium lansingense]|uniref:mersacidin/lichenicidin family type 2 lantibiotic n=1 Tax=Archangium lansingense TaxID=2995310 RepID=UPI003B7F5F1E
MSNVDVVRAWKDEQYRMSLTTEERAQLPQNPAGMVELTDSDLEGVAGGLRDADIDVSVTKTSCCTYSTTATACC